MSSVREDAIRISTLIQEFRFSCEPPTWQNAEGRLRKTPEPALVKLPITTLVPTDGTSLVQEQPGERPARTPPALLAQTARLAQQTLVLGLVAQLL